MKRTVTRLAASMAIAMFATVTGAFGADNIGYCVTNQNVTFNESMLADGDAVFVYTNTASEFTFTTTSDIRAWILAIGGGGAGGTGLAENTGRGEAGGGGAGGFVETNGFRMTSGSYTIGVGAGGVKAKVAGGNGSNSYVRLGSVDKFLAKGGGGGTSAGQRSGIAGASGGGGSFGSSTEGAGGAAEVGQGNVGGRGMCHGGGGGGGGAGGAGEDTTEVQKGGAGGSGKASTITGESMFYAGGGGGGSSSATCVSGGLGGGGSGGGSGTLVAVSGTDGLGGGGGGGGAASLSTDRNGANGGSGIVIIRISKVYGEIPYPDVRDYEYTGKPITVWEGDDECTITGHALTQTDVGEYSFSAKPKDGATWAGGSTEETNYTWRIVKSSNYLRIVLDGWIEGSGATPTPKDFCEYKVTDESDEPKVLFSDAEDGVYSTYLPTAPGLYWVKASIAEKSGYYDGASAGPQKFRILGATESPVMDRSLKYFSPITIGGDISTTGKVTIDIPNTHNWVATYNDGQDVRFCDILGNLFPCRLEAWNGDGSARFTVDVPPMKAGSVFYMCWGETVGKSAPTVDEPSADVASVSVSVGATVSDTSLVLQNWIRDLSMSGWRKGEPPSVPKCVAKIGTVLYRYAIVGSTPSIPYDPSVPPEPNEYDLRAEIEAVGGEYSWAVSENVVTFRVLDVTDSPLRDLAYFAPITATGTQSEPRCVTVTMPATIDYTTIFNDGSDVRFCDAGGNILANALLGTWTTDGTAKFSVELPAFTSSYRFYACWGPVAGTSVPAAGAPTAAAATGISLSAMGTVVRDPKGTPLVNHWVTEPVFPSSWTTDDTPTYTTGVPAYPSSGYEFKFICRNIMSGVVTVTNELPNVGGDYQLMAFVDSGDFGDGSGWAGITNAPYEVSVTTHDPAISVTRNYGAEGRVLLMNDETAPGFEIRNQGYCATNATASTYWEHTNTVTLSSAYQSSFNMSNETTHVLWTLASEERKRLWTLYNCRQGNVFSKADGNSLVAAQNFLPWGSDTALDFDGNASHTRHGAGNIVMMNTTDSCVISSCYEEGIGTIYFDVVNGGRITAAVKSSEFRIQVLVATDCKTSAGVILKDVAPLDEYVREFDEEPPSADVLTTNVNWRLVDVFPLRVQDGILVDTVDTVAKTNTVELDVSKGGSDKWYYRIVVPLDFTRPARFKIQRVSSATGAVDLYTRYILLDNIIASYPAMRASITTYGEEKYDKDRTGKDVIGMPAALSEAFPSPSSTTLLGRGKVSYMTNAGVINPATNDFITSARFHYRWRYLNQLFYHDGVTARRDDGVFASARLSAADGYVTTLPLDLPGLPGDIEYWYELMLAAPYYEYHDYSGLDAGVGNYTENITNFIGRADSSSADSPYSSMPSTGTNWFVRVREGSSQFEKVELTVKDDSVDPATTEYLSMELVGDHLWRGFVTVTNKTERKLSFFITGRNKQVNGDAEYAFNSVEFRSAVTNVNLKLKPYTGKMVDASEEFGYIASVEYLPNVASYLEFQFNDETKAIAVSHADYQDFDSWSMSRNDGNLANKFYTSMYETNSTSITKTRYPASKSTKAIAGFAATPRTQDLWTEDFSFTGTQMPPATGFLNTPFESAKTIKSSWDASQGMWIPERWGVVNTNDMTRPRDFALQMEGCGKGAVTFNLTPAPNGLDTINFSTRLAQFIDLDDIAYCIAPSSLTMTNYTFVAQACFDEDLEFKNFSGEGSISLFAGYRPSRGAYEYRVTVYNVDQAGPTCCRHTIYKWKPAGGKLVAEPLFDIRGDEIGWSYNTGTTKERIQKMALGKNSNQYSGIFISFSYDKILGHVTITAGVTMTGGTGTNKQVLKDDFTYTDLRFFQMSVVDESPVTTRGTYGVLSRNCPARIHYPRIHADKSVPIPETGTTLLRGGKYWDGKVSLIATTGTTEYNNLFYFEEDPEWVLPLGQMERFRYMESSGQRWGLMASTNVAQTVKVDVLPLDSSSTGWTNLAEVVVNSFNFVPHEFAMRTTSPCHVKISAGGTADDARMDVAIDDISLTQWCGTSGTDVNPASSSYGYWKDFYYMGAWISNSTSKVAMLAPRRADSPNRPIGIRTPYLTGYGAIMFEYKDCGEGAELEVQRLDITAGNMYSHLEDTADTSLTSWTTIERFTFAPGERGMKTVYLGKRTRTPENDGILRIVIPQSKVRTAYAHPEYDPNWGAVTITDIYCYNEPAFDNHSWWGWNFLTTGWDDGTNNVYAALDDHKAGGVGVINNTLDVNSLDTGDQDDYTDNSPFIQSPTIGSRSIGEISFRARRYDIGSATPSYVTIWGATDGNAQRKEDWIAITNVEVTASTYARYTVKCSGDEGYTAIRIGVAKVTGIQAENALEPAKGVAIPDGSPYPVRALIDEVVIRERVTPEVGFKLGFVRPFRLGLPDFTAVENISSRDQQPLLNEQFGFQAEVEIRGLLDEVDLNRTPEVTLSYYPSESPWGFENWKDAAGAVLNISLAPAEGTNLIFRSTSAVANSFAGPYDAEDPYLRYRVVQYNLKLRYWDKGGDPHDRTISSSEWEAPPWYYGFEAPTGFSPYTLLDNVSPGRAWINEINFTTGDSDNARQFLEVCFPAGYDMTGWRIYRYDAFGEMDLVATLGLTDGIPSTKDATGGHPDFAFLVLTHPDRAVDGADANWVGSMMWPSDSYGFRLVRPSGVIEQQSVVQGNVGSGRYESSKLGTNMVETLEAQSNAGGKWKLLGADILLPTNSVSAVQNAGTEEEDWANDMNMTPGRLNCDDNIPLGWFLAPNGTNVWLTLSTAGGFAWILDGDKRLSGATIAVPQGVGTNLMFETAPWNRLSLVRDVTNEVSASDIVRVPGPGTGATNRWTYTFVESARSSASLVASGTLDDSVFERGGLERGDIYVPAIMNWLVGGMANGKSFAQGEISTNSFYQGLAPNSPRIPLSLKDRYWLDIDPTSDDWDLRGDMSGMIPNVIRDMPFIWPQKVTNLVVTATLMVSNKVNPVLSYAPYRLQGLAGEKSDVVGAANWTSETFKVMMSLVKPDAAIVPGESIDVRNNYWPLSQFVFGPGSFCAPDGPHPFSARIEVWDPMSEGSPAYSLGWGKYPGSSYWYKWDLSHGRFIQAPSMLEATNTWDKAWEVSP